MTQAKLTPADLHGLEQYARLRPEIRAQVMDHKKLRVLHIGPNATWLFEDRFTVQYQVQEMLRAERIFEPDGIQDELDAYNPLIPDGSNWKVTFLVEFTDAAERRKALSRLIDIEDRCWVQVEGFDKVWAIADEDLDRETDEKTSSVHFLRFELTDAMRQRVKAGAAISVGIDHQNYRHVIEPLPAAVRESLVMDLA